MEWLKCRARANRWKEEIQLVEEEMRRSLEFCKWLHSWWTLKGNHRAAITSNLQEGLIAYAAEMAHMEERRYISWAMTWVSIHERARLVLERHLNSDKEGEEGLLFPKLTVEIDIEDDEELFDDLSDTE